MTLERERNSDVDLLRDYEKEGSEGAFRQLVERHLPMVFGLALRRTGNRQVAEEVSQNVFILLARKARRGKLSASGPLNGWLYQTTVYQSSNALRTERHRLQTMERFEKSVPSPAPEEPAALDPELHDMLDAAVGRLKPDDRSIVLQRFVEGLTYREIGHTIGATEDTSRKRVSAALDKLTAHFKRHGHVVPAAALTATLTATHSGEAMPAGLAAAVTQKAISASATAVPSTIGAGAGAFLAGNAMTIAAAVVAFSAPVALQLRANSSVDETPAENPSAVRAGGRSAPPVAADKGKNSTRVTPSIAETLRKLANHPNPVHARAAIAGFLADLPHHQMRPALEALPRIPGINARIDLGQSLFTRWATFDPREALKAAETVADPDHKRGARWGSIVGWTARDPLAAEAYIASLPEGGRRSQLADAHWWGLAETDPEGAMAKARALDDSEALSKRSTQAFNHWSRNDPAAALEYLREVPDNAKRDAWIRNGVRHYAHVDPETAFRTGLEFVSGGAPNEILKDALTSWSANDPFPAFAAAVALPPDPEFNDTIERMAASLKDWKTAQDLLSTLPAERRDLLIHGFTRGADWGSWSESPEVYPAIAKLIPSISDRSKRLSAAANLLQGWEKNSPEAAGAWHEEFKKAHDD